jgi:hypothetical protein
VGRARPVGGTAQVDEGRGLAGASTMGARPDRGGTRVAVPRSPRSSRSRGGGSRRHRDRAPQPSAAPARGRFGRATAEPGSRGRSGCRSRFRCSASSRCSRTGPSSDA